MIKKHLNFCLKNIVQARLVHDKRKVYVYVYRHSCAHMYYTCIHISACICTPYKNIHIHANTLINPYWCVYIGVTNT